MKKILLVGVFDLFHIGHLNLFEKAKKIGDYLIVAVHNDINNTKNVQLVYGLKDRIHMVNSLKIVDKVITYKRVDLLVKKIDFDIFGYGPDQNHEFFQEAFKWCKAHNKILVKISRTKRISSSKIREILKTKEI